jgi:hypothetical protein
LAGFSITVNTDKYFFSDVFLPLIESRRIAIKEDKK